MREQRRGGSGASSQLVSETAVAWNEMVPYLETGKRILRTTSVEHRVDLGSIVGMRVGEERLAWSFLLMLEYVVA